MRDPADPLASAREQALAELFADLEREPYRHDLMQTLRRIEALTPHLPRLGRAARPAAEPVRLAQAVALGFAPATLAGLERAGTRAPRLRQHAFGLLGPNGPMPLHLTDLARERILHEGDATLARFLDLLGHRLALLLYRAWADARPTVSLDRGTDDRYAGYVGAAAGVADVALRAADAVPGHARLHFAAHLGAQTRRAEGLEAILGAFFGVPARVEAYVGRWLRLPAAEYLRLGGAPGRDAARLGGGALVGRRVWDRQHGVRIHLGPMARAQYEALLPGGAALPQLAGLVRHYLGRELVWDARLILRAADVPSARLGRLGRLGYTGWLGRRRGDAGDLRLGVEARVPPGAGAPAPEAFKKRAPASS